MSLFLSRCLILQEGEGEREREEEEEEEQGELFFYSFSWNIGTIENEPYTLTNMIIYRTDQKKKLKPFMNDLFAC